MSNLSDLVGDYFKNNKFVNCKHKKIVEYLLAETSEDVIINRIDTNKHFLQNFDYYQQLHPEKL